MVYFAATHMLQVWPINLNGNNDDVVGKQNT